MCINLFKGNGMKLEMRVWDMDVRLELEDDDTEDQLSVLTTVRDLLDMLSRFEKVNVSITQIEDADEEVAEEDEEENHTEVVQDHAEENQVI